MAAPHMECLGPDYKPDEHKPMATVSKTVDLKNVTVLPKSPQLIVQFTKLRDAQSKGVDFITPSTRVMRLVIEEALNHLPTVAHTVTTPVGLPYAGLRFEGKICGVGILRAGESMEQVLRDMCPGVKIGKILIQRDEETAQPKLFYDKLPEDIAKRWVLLLDPMLATGGSALMAADVLISRGVPEEKILFLNVLASPEGIEAFANKYPKLHIITGFVDQGMNDKKYIVPGLGDFGDRWYTN